MGSFSQTPLEAIEDGKCFYFVCGAERFPAAAVARFCAVAAARFRAAAA
jgi:hypothetical protein